MKEKEKVWGKELCVVNEEQYCGKILDLKEGFISSYHKHLNKDETFLVTEGRVLLKLENEEYILQKDSVVHVSPGDFHSFEGISDAKIIEFSTHHDDADIVRQTESHKIEKVTKEEEKVEEEVKEEEGKKEETKEEEKEEPIKTTKEEIEAVAKEQQEEKKPEVVEAIQKEIETTEKVIEEKVFGVKEDGTKPNETTPDSKE